MTTVSGSIDAARMLRLVHHHPGRIRMRAEVFRGDTETYERVRSAIEAVPGVVRVEHNPGTGSVLVEYTPGIAEPDAILAVTAETAGLDGVLDRPLPEEQLDPARMVIRFVRGVDTVARELSGGRTPLGFIVPAALATAAVYSFAKDANAPRWPRWDNLSIWAYTVFLEWNRQRIVQEREAADTVPPVAP